MKYTVKRVLAQTIDAEVFLAECSKTEDTCMVLIKTDLPGINGMLHEKLVIAKLLNHPNIQKLIDFGEYVSKDEIRYYTCNLKVDGMHLSQLLQKLAAQKLKPPLPLVSHVICSVCDALEYTQNLKFEDQGEEFIPHGDICPDNIMISYDGDVFLLNSGFADCITYRFNGINLIKNCSTLFTHPDVNNGKPLQKSHEYYSVGMLLFCMLAGIESFISYWDKFDCFHEGIEKKIFPQISQSMHSLIGKLTVKNVDSRYRPFQSMKALKKEIHMIFPKYNGNQKELSGLITRAIAPSTDFITIKKGQQTQIAPE